MPGMVIKKPRKHSTIPAHESTAAIPPAAEFRDGPTRIILFDACSLLGKKLLSFDLTCVGS